MFYFPEFNSPTEYFFLLLQNIMNVLSVFCSRTRIFILYAKAVFLNLKLLIYMNILFEKEIQEINLPSSNSKLLSASPQTNRVYCVFIPINKVQIKFFAFEVSNIGNRWSLFGQSSRVSRFQQAFCLEILPCVGAFNVSQNFTMVRIYMEFSPPLPSLFPVL